MYDVYVIYLCQRDACQRASFFLMKRSPKGSYYDLSVNAITANAIKHGMITYKNGLGIDRLGMNHSTL